MAERFFYWAGVIICALLTIGVGAIALEWAANRAVRTFGVYRELVAFMWERAKRKRASSGH